jgi:hypothetical protein
MKITPTCTSHTVSAIEMVSVVDYTRYSPRTQNFVGNWFILTSDYRTWTKPAFKWWSSGSSAAKPKYTYTQNFHDWCSTHRDGSYPHHLHRVQNLLPGDHVNRARLCLHIVRAVLLTDKALFVWDSSTNAWNSHSRAHENPHEVGERHFQQRLSVKVLCGVLGDNMIGPHAIEGRVTAPPLQEFCGNWIAVAFWEYASCNTETNVVTTWRRTTVFRQSVNQVLNEDYEGRWIGRNGLMTWPARSPDLNPLQLFLWGCIKLRA